MGENCCPQCNSNLSMPTCRLVQDSCGHRKCRLCLLQDEDRCRQCNQTNNNDHTQQFSESSTVIKFENSHTATKTSVGGKTTAVEGKSAQDHTFDRTGANNVRTQREAVKSQTVSTANRTDLKNKKRNYQMLVIPSHITVLQDPVSYRCNICSKIFSTKSHIKYHTYCKGGNKPLQCTECNKEFINKSHLKIHSYIHAGTKPYTCNICKRSFSVNSKLTRHKQLHGQVKSFMCQQCGKSYHTKDSLKIHMYVHSGEKPYKCSICDARFTNSSNLNKHIVSHSNDKVHMCDQCGKRFKLKWALTVHRRSHSRLRPFVCTNCSKAFVNAKDLNRHQLIHIEVKAFSCGICHIGFRRKDNLERHMRNTHPGERAKPIKNLIKPNSQNHTKPLPADNPNAINVITASPSSISASLQKAPSFKLPFVNPPVKLAFKTSTFKNNYNLNRDYPDPPKIHPKPYDLYESVNICQKILSPHGSSPPSSLSNVPEDSTTICQKILGPCHPLHYETSFEHKKHAVIKNIKFKLPPEYINMKGDICSDLKPLEPVENVNLTEVCGGQNSTYTELKNVNAATSVIVNGQSQRQDLHWRRRTAQNLNMQAKQ